MEAITIFTLLLALGFVFGRMAEQRHFVSLRDREQALSRIPAWNTKTLPADAVVLRTELAVGSVVVSVDYFKRFVAGIRGLIGGELGTYTPLLERARREALLRMKESCPGAQLFVNTRLQTATLSSQGGNVIGTVEILAYATAIHLQKEPARTEG